MAYFTKQVISISSETTTYVGGSGKVAKIGKAINGLLYAVHVTATASTADGWGIHIGSSDVSKRVIHAVHSKSTGVILYPRSGNSPSTAAIPATTMLRILPVFADEVPYVVVGGTQKAFTLTLYVDGHATPGGDVTTST